MFALTNETILNELKKSGEQFANLFVENKAEFIPLPQSGDYRKDSSRYVAQVNDVITVVNHNCTTNTLKFRTYVVMP